MQFPPRLATCLLVSFALWLASSAQAADEPDLDALDLKSAPVAATETAAQPTRIFAELAVGSAAQRYSPGSQGLRRASLDLYHSRKLSSAWRLVLSDRLDHVRPRRSSADDTLNSLREAHLTWQGDEDRSVIDVGRINLRYGPGYGYNPTDFFRDGALRGITSVNPFARRENRLGTVALRGQRLWQGGSLSIALSPKLADQASDRALSLDFGATNNRNRVLLAASQQLSESVSAQALLYKEPGQTAQPGASLTALVSDGATAHVEWAYSKRSNLLNGAWGPAGSGPAASPFANDAGHRVVGGLSYTTASKLSLTAEAQYNGLALSHAEWQRSASAGPALLGGYLLEAQRLQELASRRAYLFYATQRSMGLKNLDLTAFLRVNANDHSRLSWLELRYHWTQIDVALQWQQHSGRVNSEYGLYPDRHIVQLVATYHFQ